jgi:CrcB protein
LEAPAADRCDRHQPRAMLVLLVGAAGFLGVVARYGISSGFHGDALPWATVGINVLGSFLLGLLVVNHSLGEDARTALGVGFLGGFTTFSTFTVQAVLDVDAGEPGRAVAYVGASLLLGFAAAAAGYYLGRALA